MKNNRSKSQTEVDQNVLSFLGDMTITTPEDLVALKDLIAKSLKQRPYNDQTKKHADSIQWKRTASEILQDKYVYEGKACSDFAIVFLAVCRAAGVEGLLVKLKSIDQTHSIVEVKLKEGWYRIDPSMKDAAPFKGQLTKDSIWNKKYKVWKKGRDNWDLGLTDMESESKIDIATNISKTSVILMHGKNTNPSQKWYPWLKEKMNENNIYFKAPALPNPDNPEINQWINELEKTKPNENSILIGHSLGGVAILRWLEKQKNNFKVKKVILVATNSGKSEKRDKTENNKGFYTEEGYDFKKIKSHCNEFTVLHSKDDEWVPFEAGVENAKGLDAKFLQFDDRGHFGSKLPKPEIPELLDEIL